MFVLQLLLPALLIFSTMATEAYAYLDPGTGSILLQGLIAAIATALATGKYWWHRVKSLFVKSEEVDATENSDDQT